MMPDEQFKYYSGGFAQVGADRKKQTTVHSNIDDATLQRVINETLKKLNN
jgi:hypothetical protein